MTPRLSSVAPDLVSRLDECSDDELRAIAAFVAREAVTSSGLLDPTIAATLDQIAVADIDTAAALHELADRLDEVAWELQDAEDNRDYLAAFRRARAASAVAFAAAPDRLSGLESVYEAQAALGSIDLLRVVIDPLLART